MNKKEEELLQEIVNYVNENNYMPTRRYLQIKLGYKSVNSITYYINKLIKQNYLKKNTDGKIVIDKSGINYQKELKTIRVINTRDTYIRLFLNKSYKYVAYKIHNEYFNNIGILRNDILIVQKNRKLYVDDIALFIIDKKYRVMKYNYKDGFYLLTDNEEILLNRVKIIGKVIGIERKLWDNLKVFSNNTYY